MTTQNKTECSEKSRSPTNSTSADVELNRKPSPAPEDKLNLIITQKELDWKKLNEDTENEYQKSLDSWLGFGIAFGIDGEKRLIDCKKSAREEAFNFARHQERERIIGMIEKVAKEILNCPPKKSWKEYNREEEWRNLMKMFSKLLTLTARDLRELKEVK